MKRGAKARADEQEPDEEAYGSGRAGKKPRSPYPSRRLVAAIADNDTTTYSDWVLLSFDEQLL